MSQLVMATTRAEKSESQAAVSHGDDALHIPCVGRGGREGLLLQGDAVLADGRGSERKSEKDISRQWEKRTASEPLDLTLVKIAKAAAAPCEQSRGEVRISRCLVKRWRTPHLDFGTGPRALDCKASRQYAALQKF